MIKEEHKKIYIEIIDRTTNKIIDYYYINEEELEKDLEEIKADNYYKGHDVKAWSKTVLSL